METLTENEIEDKTTKTNDFVFYSILVGENLNNRLNRRISKLKSTDGPGNSKQKWVLDAIKEKLHLESQSEYLPKEKFISLKIHQNLHKQILKRVERMCEVRKSFSQKQWIVEAIADKLERDEKKQKKT